MRSSLLKRVALGAALLIATATPMALAAVSAQPAGAVGPATQLVFVVQPPAQTVSGVPFGVAIAVADASGNVVITDPATTHITLTSVGAGSTLSGCSQHDPVTNAIENNGIITFKGCKLTGAATGITLHAVATSGTLNGSTADSVNTGIAVVNDQLAAGGSDTIEALDGSIFSATESSPNLVNIPVPNHLSGTLPVPGDSHCNTVTYSADGTEVNGTPPASDGNGRVVPPANSTEGRTDLENAVGTVDPSGVLGAVSWPTGPTGQAYTGITTNPPGGGCLDIARGSSSSALAQTENYAFAVDAVAEGTTSLKAPASLTLAQIQNIWKCNVNDWSQVGGAPGPIQRVLPKFGSGTRKYFINNVLNIPKTSGVTDGSAENDTNGWLPPTGGTAAYSGFDSSTGQNVVGGTTHLTCPAAIGAGGALPAVTVLGTFGGHNVIGNTGVEENDGTQFEGGAGSQTVDPGTGVFDTHVNLTGLDTYVFPYSAGKWAAQSTHEGNPTLDLRSQVRLNGIQGTLPGGTANLTSYPVAYAVRFNGNQFQLNNGTILGKASAAADGSGASLNSTRTVTVDTVVASGAQVITADPCSSSNFFSDGSGAFATDVGYNLQEVPSTHIFDGTSILSVDTSVPSPAGAGTGCTATIDTTVKAAGTGVPLALGWAVVSEKNPQATGATLGGTFQYPGVRFLFNIINKQSPDYTAAKAVIGFDDTGNGNVSLLCNGGDIGLINGAGFLDLAKTVKTTGNKNGLTCRKS